jgi:hypothetical protein
MKPEINLEKTGGAVAQERLVRRFRWNITNERTGDKCTYNAAHGIPVTEDHVRMWPKVREWVNGDPIHIFPPNTPVYSPR